MKTASFEIHGIRLTIIFDIVRFDLEASHGRGGCRGRYIHEHYIAALDQLHRRWGTDKGIFGALFLNKGEAAA